jgi:hypothetical protein
MAGAFHDEQTGFPRNHLDRLPQLLNRSKRIARPMHEQSGRVQIGQMLGALLLWPAWWMQRIRKQQKSSGKFRFFGAKHACLTPTVGMPTEEDAAGNSCSERSYRILQSRAIMRGIARPRRSPGSHLPKRQFAAQHDESCGAETFSHRDQQRGVRVPARTMGENEPVATRSFRNVQKSPNVRFGGKIGERVTGRGDQATILTVQSPYREAFARLRVIIKHYDRCRECGLCAKSAIS